LSKGLENYRAGETGLLRLTWDNGDRTVLVNPELGGITLGWRLTTPRRTNCSPPSKARPSTRA
jgi:L-ribulokinase